MVLNRNAKLKDVLGNPEAYAILQKYVPTLDKDDPRIKPALGMTVKALLAFPQTKCPKEDREAFFAELEAANLS